MRSLADDLRARSDAELASLLIDRPDLARPTPADLTTLAARATTQVSIQRVLETLDLAHLHTLESLVISAPASVAQVATLLGTEAGTAQTLCSRLWELALVWRSPDGMHVPRPVCRVLGEEIAGLGPEVPGAPSGTELDDALSEVSGPGRILLEALTWGPPVGVLPAVAPDAATASPISRAGAALVTAGLLHRVDEEHVLLPRQVALALRGGRLHRNSAITPGPIDQAVVDPLVVDQAAGGRAGELIALVTEVIDEWGARPPRVLRSGGLAVRDLTRLSQHLEIDEAQTAWLVEVLHSGRLIAADHTGESAWLPTQTADDWLGLSAGQRWALLARAWWSMPTSPALVGSTSTGRVNALSLQTSYPPARQRRQDVLAALARLDPGSAPTMEGIQTLLRWRHPLRTARADKDRDQNAPGSAEEQTLSSEQHALAIGTVLREAGWAGLTGRDALAQPGRLIVTTTVDPHGLERGDDPSDDPAGVAMEAVIPAAVHEVLLQADLTAIAPGRLDGPARTLMHLVADIESRGGASVHRFSERSVRRALDTGWSADRLITELEQISATGIPQPLDYLIRDVSRRHGVARVGACAAYLRCDDLALLDRIQHDRALGLLQWRRIAPTVLITAVPAPTVLDLLREEQYGPIAENADGGLQLVAAQQRRAANPAVAPVLVRSVDAEIAAHVVTRMRRGEDARAAGFSHSPAAGGIPSPSERRTSTPDLRDAHAANDPMVLTATLRDAASDGLAVWIGYADDTGGVSTRLVRPLRVEAGRMRATLVDGDAERVFLLHRITAVRATE